MKIFRFLLLLSLPAFLLSPIPSYTFESKTYHLETGQELFIPKDENGLINPWGYFHPQTILTHLDGYVDHVFGFVDLLEDVDFLESLCDEEAERLIDFVIFIVRFSVPKSRPDLAEKYEQEIAELLDLMYEDEGDEEEYKLSSNHDCQWEFVPAVCFEKPEFILCKKKKKKKKDKSWISRKWHHFTHWVDKNKEPIIAIGAVAVGAIIGGLTGRSDSGDGTPPDYINKAGEVRFRDDPPEYSPPPAHVSPNDSISTLPLKDFQLLEQTVPISEPAQILDEAPLIVQESIEEIKEELVEENISEKGTAKEFASYMTHQILDEVSDYGLKHVVGEETIEAGHELIDRAFGTDYASEYTEEFKEEIAHLSKRLGIDIAIAELPPPTAISGAITRTGAAVGSVVVAQEAMTVYKAFNELTGEVKYVGITNDFERRFGEHLRNKDIEIFKIQGLENLSRSDARAVEQTLIELHELEKNGGTLINKINSIAESNPAYAESLKIGAEILEEVGYEE